MDYKDYYKIMGLSRDAAEKDIKTAYRKLARKYHPDVSKELNAEEKFKELGEAYEVLKDPEKRKLYDQYAENWKAAQQAGGAQSQQQQHHQQHHWHAGEADGQFDADFFESLFGKRHNQYQAQSFAGEDYHSTIHLPLTDAYQGGVREIHLQDGRGKKQTLRVKIPAGVYSGQQIRLAGLGAHGVNGGPQGDLYLTVQIEKHPYFDLKEKDIYLTLPITPWEAALGATVGVPTLGGKVDLKIPKGSQGGQTLRLKHRGMPGKTIGDQFIHLKIVTPLATTDADVALYQKMAETMPFNPRKSLEE